MEAIKITLLTLALQCLLFLAFHVPVQQDIENGEVFAQGGRYYRCEQLIQRFTPEREAQQQKGVE